MQNLGSKKDPEAWTIVLVDPDELLAIAHRIKKFSMEHARFGEAVTVPLTDKILLLYEPDQKHSKTNH